MFTQVNRFEKIFFFLVFLIKINIHISVCLEVLFLVAMVQVEVEVEEWEEEAEQVESQYLCTFKSLSLFDVHSSLVVFFFSLVSMVCCLCRNIKIFIEFVFCFNQFCFLFKFSINFYYKINSCVCIVLFLCYFYFFKGVQVKCLLLLKRVMFVVCLFTVKICFVVEIQF